MTGGVSNIRFYVVKGHVNTFSFPHQSFAAFFVMTCYQACTWDHSCSRLQREVPYLLHAHYMLLPDII